MRRTISFLICFFLLGNLFSQNYLNYFSGQYVPKTQIKTDSIFYLFTLKSLYELHTTKEYTNIYSIKWHSFYNFDMVLQSSSSKEVNSEKTDLTNCTIVINADSSALVAFKNKNQSREIILRKYADSKISRMMLTRDNEYKKIVRDAVKSQKWETEVNTDSTAQMKYTVDTSLQLKLTVNYLQKDLDNYLEIPMAEIKAISNMFADFRNFDAEAFYLKSSRQYREDVSSETNKLFFTDYLKEACGELEYFSLSSQSMALQSENALPEESEPSEFEFDVKFVNISKEFKLQASIVYEKDPVTGNKIAGVKNFRLISPEDFNSNFIDSLTFDFFKNFENKNYGNIYSAFDSFYKEINPKEKIENSLNLAEKAKENKKYTLYKQGSQITKQNKVIIKAVYKIENKTTTYLYLSYVKRNGRYFLCGIDVEGK